MAKRKTTKKKATTRKPEPTPNPVEEMEKAISQMEEVVPAPVVDSPDSGLADTVKALEAKIRALEEANTPQEPVYPSYHEEEDGPRVRPGVVTMPPVKVNPRKDLLSSEGHGGEHRDPTMGGKGVPKALPQMSAPIPTSETEPEVQVQEVILVDPSTLPDTGAVSQAGSQPKRLKVTLWVHATPKQIGPPTPPRWNRIVEPTYWNSMLQRSGDPKYGDPVLECQGVQLDDHSMDILMGRI